MLSAQCSRLCCGLMLRSPLRAQGMSVVRLNMSHGDHKSHKAVVDLVREYNALDRGNLAIMLDTKGPEVRSGDLSEPIDMKAGGCPPVRLHCAHVPGRPEAISIVILNAVVLEMKVGGCLSPRRQSALDSCVRLTRGSANNHVVCDWAQDVRLRSVSVRVESHQCSSLAAAAPRAPASAADLRGKLLQFI